MPKKTYPFSSSKPVRGFSQPPEPRWREWPLALAVPALALTLLGKAWIATALDQNVVLIALLLIICGVILTLVLAIVRHADILAQRLGEPIGTLLLTLTVTGLEVAMVAFVMFTGVGIRVAWLGSSTAILCIFYADVCSLI